MNMEARTSAIAGFVPTRASPVLEAPDGPGLRERRLDASGIIARLPSLASGALLAGDAVCLAVAYIAVAAGADAKLNAVALLVSFWLLFLFCRAGLYPGYRIHAHERLRRRTAAIVRIGLIGAACVGVLVGSWATAGQLAGFLALAGSLQMIVAPGVQWLLRRFGLWGEAADIVAGPDTRTRLDEYFRDNWRLGVIPVDTESPSRPATALVAEALPGEALERLRARYEHVVLLADIPDAPALGLKLADVDGEIGLQLSGAEPVLAMGLRRAADITIAALALVCVAPVILIAALLIWIVDPGPVFFRQAREGLHGRTVRILKLRTMYQDAEERLQALLAADPAARKEWDTYFKLRSDPRVLPFVGNFLRSSSCDELPQLVNVLLGDMGLVGPRPFPPYHLAAMPSDFRRKRATVTPGLTGLWQVSARSEADVARAQQFDEFYIDNRSLWLDLSILLKTFSAVVRRTGAY